MSIGSQFKGISGSKPHDSNSISRANKVNKIASGEQPDTGLRISYAVIEEVDHDTSRVRVKIFDGQSNPQDKRSGSDNKGTNQGRWYPVLQPLYIIHHLFGSLRKGLIVRVFWRGKTEPGSEAVVEVISDATRSEFLAGNKEPRSNELAVGPHRFATGGSTGYSI